jgi:hypothetical protein
MKTLLITGYKGLDLITTLGDGEVNDNSLLKTYFMNAEHKAYELAELGKLESIQVIVNGKIQFTVELNEEDEDIS